MLRKFLWIILTCCGVTQVYGTPTTCETSEQSLWNASLINQALESKLATLFQCIDTSDPTEYKLRDATACNWFVGKSLETVWNFSDFKNGGGYFTANELADRLSQGVFSHWKAIGSGDQQEANDTAAMRAADGNPVVAAWQSNGPTGHVALIIPGGLAFSSSWGVNVPRSASISLNDIDAAYIGCRLSNAFGANKKSEVQYYYRDLLPF
ncbi:hypothetical protein BSZ21_05840 [Bradyrhizobium canariense]|uniref:hypothetical protein n=1 Tax=Bradyrhizobium canariense TaxID=255045 RepID=UPI000A18F7C2|nr:hypothetical protein [Bradyrhizobium canariense]OSI74429.1 hypothetical protein BSZ21_05840 [Bradyrhizobium canariense]